VFGIGVNDVEYAVQIKESVPGRYKNGKKKQRLVWMCPFYSVWADMLRRSYDERCKHRRPSYKEATVCEDWHRLSVFKEWMEKQDWQGNHLDKDLLLYGNKVYSADTCVFISPVVNTFLNEGRGNHGPWPIGVYWHKTYRKFKAQVSNPFNKYREHLGFFTCQNEAHKAWLSRKLEIAYMLAEKQTDDRVANALVERYKNYDM